MQGPKTIRLLAPALLLVGTAAAAGELYQWKDASGVTHYSQTPPASGSYRERSDSGRAPAAPAQTAQATAPSESPQCATSRANIALLESKGAVQQDVDGDGKADKTLGDAERAAQLELARAVLKANCAGSAASAGK